ncbi:hypothetical protein AeNC1_017393, partial [Aphanomyces euteiches]
MHFPRLIHIVDLMNTAKRGKGAAIQVPIGQQKDEIPFISGKRRHDAVEMVHETGRVENPSSLVCEYFDFTTREKFVGLAVCLMWGVKSCTIEVTPFDLCTAIVTYKWPPQLSSVEKKLEKQLETSTQKMRIYAKMQAFAAAFEELIQQSSDMPTTTQLIKLPREVEPKKFECNFGKGDLEKDLIIVEFK